MFKLHKKISLKRAEELKFVGEKKILMKYFTEYIYIFGPLTINYKKIINCRLELPR